ncbi:MAG TPA: hypothetical protein VK824_06215, partial [Planctomycetota bacterium]|nr:hypothetical protein [Planctomycetota bacterium]
GACWRNGTLNDNAAVLDYWLYYLTNSTTPAMLGKNSEFQLNGYYDHYWSSLGNSMAGTSGAPVLVGGTPIVQDGEVTLKLSNAAHPATAVLVIGMTAWYHRSVGGTQVPYPDISLPQATGTGSFEFTLPFLWPENADPLYFQFWVPDAGGPSGWAASNALEGATIH